MLKVWKEQKDVSMATQRHSRPEPSFFAGFFWGDLRSPHFPPPSALIPKLWPNFAELLCSCLCDKTADFSLLAQLTELFGTDEELAANTMEPSGGLGPPLPPLLLIAFWGGREALEPVPRGDLHIVF
jgi:hypothetical protein